MKKHPKQLRLDPDIEAEVQKIAEVTNLPQIEIIRQMVSAGVRAIKANNYKLTLPLDLAVVESDPSRVGRVAKRVVEKIKDQRRGRNEPPKSVLGQKSDPQSPHHSTPQTGPQSHTKS